MPKKIKVDVSLSSILKILFVLGLIIFLYKIIDIIILVFIVLILVAAFRPVVNKWGRKIGRVPAVLALILLLLALFGGFIYLIIPPLVAQSKQLFDSFPDFISRFTILRDHLPSFEKSVTTVYQSFGSITNVFISFTAGLFGGLITIITGTVLMVYLLLDDTTFDRMIKFLVTPSKRDDALELFQKISLKVGDWFRGQLILNIIMGTLTFIGLSIIGVKYAVILGVIAGLMEIIPVFGPLISGGLAAIVAISISPLTVLFVLILTLILHQLENNLVQPKVMQKAIGLPPAIIIIAILIGGKMLGALGALLAAPVIGILYVIIQERDIIKKLLDSKIDE